MINSNPAQRTGLNDLESLRDGVFKNPPHYRAGAKIILRYGFGEGVFKNPPHCRAGAKYIGHKFVLRYGFGDGVFNSGSGRACFRDEFVHLGGGSFSDHFSDFYSLVDFVAVYLHFAGLVNVVFYAGVAVSGN